MRPSGASRRLERRTCRTDAPAGAEGRAVINWHLSRWRKEARRRANDLGAPAVWALGRSRRPLALALDPTGELADDLARVCAEAVARAAGPHLVGGSRPLADRSRVLDRDPRR